MTASKATTAARTRPMSANTTRRCRWSFPTVMKNRPINKSLERRDVDLDLVAVFGLGQQETGEKRAERGREARGAGGGDDPHHHEQRDRHDEIRGCRSALRSGRSVAARSDRLRRWRQPQAPLSAGPRQAARRRSARCARGIWTPNKHRRHHEVLEQQHRERDTTDRRRRAPLLFEQLHHNRGRGHREAEAEHDRAAAGNAQQREAARRWQAPTARIAGRRCRQRSGANDHSRASDSSSPIRNRRNSTPEFGERSRPAFGPRWSDS